MKQYSDQDLREDRLQTSKTHNGELYTYYYANKKKQKIAFPSPITDSNLPITPCFDKLQIN